MESEWNGDESRGAKTHHYQFDKLHERGLVALEANEFGLCP